MEIRNCKPNESYKNKKSAKRVWLTEDEQEALMSHAKKRERISIGLMLHGGLRSKEVPEVTLSKITPTTTSDGTKMAVVDLRKGKDTRGYGGSSRKTIIPQAFYSDLTFFTDMAEIKDSEAIVDVTPRTVKRDVKSAVERVAENTNNDDWRDVSAHDLRRSWGHTLLVRRNINPQKLMALGGWNDMSTMMRYISVPTEEELTEEYARVL